MINVDISNVWGTLSLPDLLAIEQDVSAAHAALMASGGTEGEYCNWLKLPDGQKDALLARICALADTIRQTSDVCVVLDAFGCAGARGVMELLQGSSRNLDKGKKDPQLFFAGNSLSSRSMQTLTRILPDQDVYLIVNSGASVETSAAFRSLRWLLERKYGTDEAGKRICAIVDSAADPLARMAKQGGWETVTQSLGVGGPFGVFTSGQLLSMAVAGVDIGALCDGAAEAARELDLRSFENPAWLYTAVRHLLYRGGAAAELVGSFEPDFRQLGIWWQQLIAAGQRGDGPVPVFVEYPGEWYLPGQLQQPGSRNFFETMVRFAAPEQPCVIGSDWENLDGLNYLEGKTFSWLEDNAAASALADREEAGVSVICMDCGAVEAGDVGALLYFLALSAGIACLLSGGEPVLCPGNTRYEETLYRNLGRPGYEN